VPRHGRGTTDELRERLPSVRRRAPKSTVQLGIQPETLYAHWHITAHDGGGTDRIMPDSPRAGPPPILPARREPIASVKRKLWGQTE